MKMTAEENEAINKILTLGGITEDEARSAVSFIKQACIQGEEQKNYNAKKAAESILRLIAILEED